MIIQKFWCRLAHLFHLNNRNKLNIPSIEFTRPQRRNQEPNLFTFTQHHQQPQPQPQLHQQQPQRQQIQEIQQEYIDPDEIDNALMPYNDELVSVDEMDNALMLYNDELTLINK